MLKRRDGQVTLFIILGIVLLIIAAAFFLIQDTFVSEKTAEAQNIIENVPLEFAPVKSYTENCLKAVAEQGLVLLGQHGGYIMPEEWHGMLFVDNDPTDSDGVLFPKTEMGVPYWLYNAEPNTASEVRLASHQPTITQMEADMIRWIEEEVPLCLDQYKSFEGQGFTITESDSLSAAATIANGNVRFSLDHPLDAAKGSSEASMRHFYVEIPVDLKRLYDVAYGISVAEQNASFLERNTLSLMTLFSSSTPGKIMPMTDTTFDSGSGAFWSKKQLKEDTKLILLSYIPLLRYYQSGNFFSYKYPEADKYSGTKQRIYNDMVLPLTGAEGLDVRFDYLNFWEPYFEMNCEGDTCRPQSVSVTMFGYPFSMQRYKAVYDISYPVLVSLRDNYAFDGRGYTFSFALEANVRNNRPAFDGVMLPIQSNFEESLLCDENQRNSGNISVVVHDAYSAMPVENAEISFVLDTQSCTMGNTNEGGVLISQFPIALGGVVHAVAADYVGSIKALDTSLGKNEIVDIELSKYVELNVGVEKKKAVKCVRSISGSGGVLTPGVSPTITCYAGGADLAESNPLYAGEGRNTNIQPGWYFIQEPFALSDEEEAIISLTRVSEHDDPVTFAAHVTGSETAPIRIPPGKYKVDIQIMSNRELVIPAREIEEDGEPVTIPEVRMDQWYSGGFNLGEDGIIEVEAGGLNSASTIVFYAVSPAIEDIPTSRRVIEDLDQMGKIEEYSKANAVQLRPIYR